MSHRSGDAGARAARPGITGNDAPVAGHARVAEIQRVRLVAAMVEVAAEHGFAGATVARVVARAGVSRRTFYELFEDREDCFLAGFDEGVARATGQVLAAYDANAGWVERLRMVLFGLLTFLEAERGMGQFLVVSSLGAGPRALRRRGRVLSRAIELVDEGREGSKGSPPPSLTAEAVVGGVLSVLYSRLPADRSPTSGAEAGGPLVDLLNPLVSMIVLPYRGPAAARKELMRAVPGPPVHVRHAGGDPLRHLDMRLTYRTVRVLTSVAESPGASNREIGESAGIADQGQISKLLARLERLGLICNQGLAPGKGAPNSWRLTARGTHVEQAMRTGAQL